MLFNTEIQTLFNNFTVDNVSIPVNYLFYEGHNEPYIVYMQSDISSSYATEDNIAGVVAIYDFDIYSKGNYSAIADAVRSKLIGAGWTWQPTRDSQDLYDSDTGYYHKTYCYAKPIQIT